MKRALAFASLGLLLSGCSTFADLNILNPTYSISDVRPHVRLAIPPSMDFDLTVGVDNPNRVGLRLDHIDFDLFVNDNQIATGFTDDRIEIPARGYGDVHLRTHVSYDNLRSIFHEVADLVQGNRANYALRGNAAYDTPVGRLTFPLSVVRNAR